MAVGGIALTVTSTPSSARMRAAYEAASSAVDMVRSVETMLYQASKIGELVVVMPLCQQFLCATDNDCSVRSCAGTHCGYLHSLHLTSDRLVSSTAFYPRQCALLVPAVNHWI